MAYPHARLAKAIIATYPHGYDPPPVNGKKPIFLLILAAIYGLPPSGALYQSFRNKKILHEFEFVSDKGAKLFLVLSAFMSDVFYHVDFPYMDKTGGIFSIQLFSSHFPISN